MQSFNFYGKPMKVSYARIKSDVISKGDGTFKPRPKRKAEVKAPPKPQSKKKKDKESSETKSLPSAAGDNQPNKILFLENLPQQTNRSEERFSRNAETDLVCRLLLEKKKTST
eukprot:TRINITY_DN4134_c0_g1_i19.p1 TRINITY_DN4134_c0_g1~~TRINITY_DN4134_c0_g1_i19.p1  ORF type:complete len:113 (-),score=27.45 TRINITY_DN4134_c0_g1_i19:10-348(-)